MNAVPSENVVTGNYDIAFIWYM